MSLNGKKIWVINKFLYLCGMKKILYISLIAVFSLVSCKKEVEYHKLTYEITFLNSPGKNSSNFIEVSISPEYPEKDAYVDRFNIPQVWRYDYLHLEKGQKVQFLVRGQLSYYFEMRIYLDGVETSYRRVIVSDYTYYADHVEESRGLNDKSNVDMGIIEFVYN